MRHLVDLQACQTSSRKRGIGRYSLELACAMQRLDGIDLRVLFDGTLPEAADAAAAHLARCGLPLRASRFAYPTPPACAADETPHGILADALYRDHVARLGVDVLHVSSVFEGFIDPIVTLLQPERLPSRMLSCATLYDLIPLVFREHYLADPNAEAWYRRRVDTLSRFDLLLAISDASRSDAIQFLGIDPARVVNISGAADLAFYTPANDADEARRVRAKFGIDESFVLYTGNGDFRKNQEGTLRAFALLPPSLRRDTQLVLNQGDEAGDLTRLARSLGLGPRDVVFTGYVDDAELRALYRCCTLFVFPSLYEGFGLPVLEAMACGAPVMAADNSSLVEVLPRRDALFDARQPEQIAQAMARGLGNADLRRDLADYGVARARAFTWERSAQLAREAQAEAFARKATRAVASVPARTRVALVTPLPPERSGISDYSADLIPALQARCTIDVFASDAADADAWRAQGIDVYPWQQLEASASRYGQVIYQFGNSPFHTHMFDLLARVPGMVVLHDIYLSGVIDHEDRFGGRSEWFADELRHAHGQMACPSPDDNDGRLALRQQYPCSRRVIEQATALLLHSDEAAAMVQRWYPWGIATPIHRIPAIRREVSVDPARRAAARARLGLGDDELLLCSFGFLAATKCSDTVARGFAQSALATSCKARLVFVGEAGGGAWGLDFADLLASLRAPIDVTGFVDADVYADHLDACDIAIQLRSDSRGESSRAVLDTLAYGIPTIINNYAAFAEIPGDVAYKLDADCDDATLAQAVDTLAGNTALRTRLRRDGVDYIATSHAPGVVAEAYLRAVAHTMAEGDATARDEALVATLADAVIATQASDADLEHFAAAALRNVPHTGPTRLLLDVSDVIQHDYGTGIHRVVRNLVRELCTAAAAPATQALPVHVSEGSLHAANAFLRDRLHLAAPAHDDTLQPGHDDMFVLLDSSWDNAAARFDAVLDHCDARGVPVCGVVYDLIPLRHPQVCVDIMPPIFERWLRWLVSRASAIACISGAVADDLADYIVAHKLPHRPGLRIGDFVLGADLVEHPGGDVPADLARVLGNGRRTYLAVGTVEPRKRHDLILDAFERRWSAGDDSQLLIVGKPGWNVEAMATRLRNHAEAGHRLHWFERLDDAGLAAAYQGATALVQASIAEGFGLPLVEALHHGVPTIASDIPVFREVTGDAGIFFAAGSVDALEQALQVPLPAVQARDWATWRDSARGFAQLLTGGRWRHRLD